MTCCFNLVLFQVFDCSECSAAIVKVKPPILGGNHPKRVVAMWPLRPADEPEVWWAQRVTDALKASADFGEYKKKRTFTFTHFFSGEDDVWSSAVRRLAARDGMPVKTY